jgi:hypothetical protein
MQVFVLPQLIVHHQIYTHYLETVVQLNTTSSSLTTTGSATNNVVTNAGYSATSYSSGLNYPS